LLTIVNEKGERLTLRKKQGGEKKNLEEAREKIKSQQAFFKKARSNFREALYK